MIKKSYLFLTLFTAFLWLGSGSAWGADPQTLTVADGTKTTYQTPVYGYYCDKYVRSQIIYPASMLTSMSGNNITAMTFYFETPSSNALSSTFQLYLKEVASTTTALSTSWMDMTGATKVFEGTIEANNTTTKTLVIEFDTPFSYNGGSLVFDLKNTASGGSYAAKKWGEYTCVFYGRKATADESSTLTGYASSATITPTRGDIRPKTMFTYEEASSGGSSTCAVPTAVTATQNNPAKATLSWTKAENQDNYQFLYVATGDEPDWTGITAQNTNSVELDGLTAGVEYDFYVRTYCSGEDQSADVKKTFSVTCPAPTAPQVTNIATTTATLSWTAASGISNYQYIVVERGAAEDWTSPILVEDAVTTSLSGLTASTKYDVYVRSYYSATAYSSSVKAQFSTPCNAMSYADIDGTFESETAGSGLMPNCWEAAATYDYSNYYSSATTTYPCVKVSYTTSEGEQCLAFHGGQNSTKNIAVLPVLSEELNTLTISFKYKNGGTSSYYGQFSVGYYVNSTFTAFTNGTLTRNSSFTLFEMAIPTVPAGARLAIQYAGGTYYNAESFIDELSLYPTPSCTKPSGVTVSNIVYNGATVTWTEDGSATNWKVQYSTDNSNWTTVNVSENPTCTLTGLTTGTPYYVQVISVCGGTDGESPAVAAASTFTPTCVTPGVPSASEKTTNSAKISWVVNSGETEWNLQYKKSSDADYTTLAGITENPYTLNGLASGTTYQVRVAATCNGTYTSAATFDTECEAKTLAGYTEGFEGFTAGSYAQTGLTCWGELNAVHTSSYSYPQMYVNTSSSYVKSGSKSLYFVSSSSTYEYAILPAFNGSYEGYQLTFSHKEESAGSSGKIALGYLTDASDAGTFQVIKEFTRSTGWVTETESINDVPTDARLAFRYGGGSSNYYAGIDDISITELPNCLVPTVVVASNETMNSASISWTNGAEESSWKLQYSTDETNWTAANEGNAFTTKPFVLEGLTANTTYYVQVKAVCGGANGESDWSASGEFETDCNAIALADFATETFATNAVPDCWKVTTVGDKSWVTTTSNYQRHSSPYAMQFAAYTEAGNYSDLISPSITLTEDAFLKFYLYNSYSSDPVVGEVYIQYGSTTEKIFDFVATNNVEQKVVDLAAYTGKTAKFIFRGHGNGQTNYRYAAIDDVEIVAKPCDAPTGLSKVESSSSVVLSWTDDAANKWNLRWREVTEPESAWNDVEDLTEKNLSLTATDNGLAFGKNYQAQVQAVCTATKSSAWSDLISFGLVCGAAPANLTVSNRTASGATLTWEGAESAFQLETSLDGENWESPVPVNAKTYNMTGLTAGQTYYVRVQNACGGAYAEASFKTWCDSKLSLPLELTSFSAMPACWEESPAGAVSFASSKLCFVGEGERFLYLPQSNIDLNLLSVTLTFSGSLELGYISEPNGAFTQLVASPVSGTEYDLATLAPESAQYLAIRYNGASSLAQSSISAISIRKTPTCLKPTGVAGAPGVGSAEISWTSEASAWNLQYKTGSADWTTVAVSENPYALSGLEQGLTYKVRVQANCGEELSDWSDEASFTTNCADVTALPFIETFDAALSNCWDITDDNTSTYASQVSGGALSLPGGKANSGHLVKLPNITASFANATMTVIYHISTDAAVANAATPQVGYMDGEDFVELEALTKTKTSAEARIELASANGHRLAIRFDDGASETTLVIEEIRILAQVTLADNVDNAALIAANLNKAADVTLGRTIFCDGDYNTICLPFDLSEEQLAESPLANASFKAFKYAVIEADELQVRVIDVEGGLEAGVPYLMKMTADENLVSPLFKNVTISATTAKTVGKDEPVEFIGTFAPVPFAKDDVSTLFVHTNNNLTWSGKEETSLKAFRAYFNRTASAPAPLRPGMRARIVEHYQMPTGIENVQNAEIKTQKFIENGRVVIIRNGVKYSVQGQVISK